MSLVRSIQSMKRRTRELDQPLGPTVHKDGRGHREDSATINDSDKGNTHKHSTVEELKDIIINQARDFSSANWELDEPRLRKRVESGLMVNESRFWSMTINGGERV